ncbi:MAG: thioredoxin-like domain-containing protein [bacterium]
MRYLIAIFLLITLFSCEKIRPVSENNTKVIIKIEAPENFEISITKDDKYDFNYKDVVIAVAESDDAGVFKFEFDLKETGVFKIKQKNVVMLDRVYLFPGDELKIYVDNTNRDDVKYKFEGKSAKVNNFVVNLNSQYPKDNEYYQNLLNPKADEFTKWVDERHNGMLEYFHDYFITDTLTDFIRNYELSNINFEWAYLKNEWAILNYYYQLDKWNEAVIPENYYSFLKDLKIEEPYLHIFLGRYLESLVWEWHIGQVKDGVQPTTQTRELAKFDFAKKKFSGETSDIAMTLCLNDLIVYSFDERMLEVLNKMMGDYKQNVKNRNYLANIENYYKKRFTILKGNPAPEFTLPNSFNAPISLKDFKGNVVYVFFWSLMYEPSLQYLKNITELQQKFENNDKITLISIEMDEGGMEKWKKHLVEQSLDGIHLYCEGLFTNKIAVDYMINNIPFAIIIDKSGKIFMMNAPYPDNDKLAGIIEGLL